MNIKRIVRESINKVLKENEEEYVFDNINRDVNGLDRMCQKFMQEQSDINLRWLVWYCKNFIEKYNKTNIR
jgi:hypothetical protein